MSTQGEIVSLEFQGVSANLSPSFLRESSREEMVLWLYDCARRAFAKKAGKGGAYYDTLKSLGGFTYDDIEVLLGNDLPELVDGRISYEEVSQGEKAQVHKETESKTLSLKLIELIKDLEKQDGLSVDDVLEQMQSNVNSDEIFSNAVAVLYLTGGQQDLINKILNKVRNPSCIIDKARGLKAGIGNNKNYGFDFEIKSAIESFVEGYVKFKMPESDLEATGKLTQSDESFMQTVELASKYAVNNSTIDHIILYSFLPKDMIDIHSEALKIIVKETKGNADMALQWADVKNNFANMSLDEKLTFGQEYLDRLARAYGFDQPPLFAWDNKMASTGGHEKFSYDDPELCFKYPLGKIFLHGKEDWSDWEYFISVLSHEFVHGIEEACLLSLNSEYQKWAGEQTAKGRKVSLGSESFQEKSKSTGMLMSFNIASNVMKTGDMPPGRYYSHVTDREKYYQQLRERHAFTLQDYIQDVVKKVVESVEVLKDPMVPFMKAQNFVFKIGTFLKEGVDHDKGKDNGWDYDDVLKNIDQYFNDAHDRSLPLSERLTKMGDLISFYSRKMFDALKGQFIKDGLSPDEKNLYIEAKGLINEIRLSVEIQDILKAKNTQHSSKHSHVSPDIPGK